MATKIHTIDNYAEFLNTLKSPNPDIIYQLLLPNYIQLEKLELDINHTLVYTDLYVGNNLKLYKSFAPEILQQPNKFLSPIYVHTLTPIILNNKILEESNPLDVITRNILTQIVGLHIPKPIFKCLNTQ